jgi:hypothetical protein
VPVGSVWISEASPRQYSHEVLVKKILQEMRMVLRAHRVPGIDDEVPTPAQVFRMATSGGAATTPFAETIGRSKWAELPTSS